MFSIDTCADLLFELSPYFGLDQPEVFFLSSSVVVVNSDSLILILIFFCIERL